MSYLHPAAEELLSQASMRWRWLIFLQRTAKLATLATALMLLLGVGMFVGWLTSAAWVAAGFVLVIVSAFFAWMVITLMTVCPIDSDRRPWLAAAIERSHRPLMDRLNTLVFLQHTQNKQLQAYVDQIEKQTQEEMIRHPHILPFSPRHALVHAGVFAAALAATIVFYGYFRPWQYVAFAGDNGDPPSGENSGLMEIPPPEEQPQEQAPESPWGDVRISEPGRDLRVTLLDVIPLRIEAAANRPLKKVEWFTALNEADDVQHQLETPDDPWYAVYRPELSVRDFAAEPWETVRYYARATTEDGTVYDSEVYFIEVVPFRDELEELPFDQQNTGVTRLEQLTSMIQRQNEVIRQTHRQSRISDPSPASRKKRVKQLADEEAKLGRDASHLGADIASRKERPARDGSENHLERAASTLENAEDSLLDDNLEEAAQKERKALGELVAARKELMEMLRKDPNALERPEGQHGEPQANSADTRSQAERMRDVEAHRKRLESAREFVQKTLLSERNLEKQADPRHQERFPNLTKEQQQLNQSLQKFVEENPLCFNQSQSECSNTQSAMNRTAQSLANKDPHARQEAGRAAETLQKLDDSLEKQQQRNRLADAYRLREMLEKQISQLSQCQKQGMSPGQGEQLAQQAKSTTGQMKQIAENEPTKEFFGEELREALNDEKMEQMGGQCKRLGQSGNPNGQKAAAGELAQKLQQIAGEFDAACPGGKGQGKQGEGLVPKGHDAIARGLRQLEHAAGGQAGGRSFSPQDRARLVREARANLGSGIASVYGNNQRSEQVIDQLDKKLDERERLIDIQTVRDLLSQIQQLSRESEPGNTPEPERAKTSNVDLSRLPSAYRQSIEKYFERLSEQ